MEWNLITGKSHNGMRYNDKKVNQIYLNIWKKIRDQRFSRFWKFQVRREINYSKKKKKIFLGKPNQNLVKCSWIYRNFTSLTRTQLNSVDAETKCNKSGHIHLNYEILVKRETDLSKFWIQKVNFFHSFGYFKHETKKANFL